MDEVKTKSQDYKSVFKQDFKDLEIKINKEIARL